MIFFLEGGGGGGGRGITELTSSSLPCSRYMLASCGEKGRKWFKAFTIKPTLVYHNVTAPVITAVFMNGSIKTLSIVTVDG